MHNSKVWSICCLSLALVLLILAGSLTALIDPYFHYHAPLDSLQYPINDQRYQNNGIVKHFDYDALITGTSMTENFKTSEMDALFGVNAVKVAYSGGTIQEISSTVKTALEHNPDIKLVLIGLDEWFLFAGREMILADGEYPTYLYDSNTANDVKYLLNKDVLFQDTIGVLEHTAAGHPTTNFDVYSNWAFIPIGKDHVMAQFQRREPLAEEELLTEELAERLEATMHNAIFSLTRAYPQVEFLIFFPPYSVLNWDTHLRQGTFRRQIDAFQMASSLLLAEENIQLYSFYTDFDTITDLDNYRDSVHYSQQISSLLLQRMASGEYRLTAQNNARHWKQVQEFYAAYDYDALFES